MIKSLSDELRRLREVHGQNKKVSLRDVQRSTGISNEYLSQLERGSASKPAPEVLQKLAEFYNVPYESLLVAAGYLKEVLTRPGLKGAIPRDVQPIPSTAKFSDDEWREVKEFMSFVALKRRNRGP